MKPKRKPALIDTPKAKRTAEWYWRLGLSRHPRDVAAVKLIPGQKRQIAATF